MTGTGEPAYVPKLRSARCSFSMKIKTLRDLFIHELKDLYSAEKQLLKALPKMAKATKNEELQSAFEEHLQQTEEHVSRLEEIFELLETSKKVTGADTKIVWASPEFLTEHAIIGEKAEGNFMPIWTPAHGEDAGIVTMSCARAQGSGLKLRPLEATIRDTLAWQASRPAEKQKLRAGLSFEKETELLAKLKLAKASG